MGKCHDSQITIRGSQLVEDEHYQLNIIFKKSNPSIIRGTIYNVDNKPSIGAAIQITEINPISCNRNILGYTFTNEQGEYLIAINVNPCMLYEIRVYSSLI